MPPKEKKKTSRSWAAALRTEVEGPKCAESSTGKADPGRAWLREGSKKARWTLSGADNGELRWPWERRGEEKPMCRGSDTNVEGPRQPRPCGDMQGPGIVASKRDGVKPKRPRPHAGKLGLSLTRLCGEGAEPRRRRSKAKAAEPMRAGLCKGSGGFRSVASRAGVLRPMRARPEADEAGPERARLRGGSRGPGCRRSGASMGLPVRKEERVDTKGPRWTGASTTQRARDGRSFAATLRSPGARGPGQRALDPCGRGYEWTMESWA